MRFEAFTAVKMESVIVCPEDEGGTFLRNVGNHLQVGTVYNPEDHDLKIVAFSRVWPP
jgi:hypothetical protein